MKNTVIFLIELHLLVVQAHDSQTGVRKIIY